MTDAYRKYLARRYARSGRANKTEFDDNPVVRYYERRYKRVTARYDADEDEPTNNQNSGGGHGNTRIPFGLCQREGIRIEEGWTPKDAWHALKGKGYRPGEVYKELQRTGKVAPRGPKATEAPKVPETPKVDYDTAKKEYIEKMRELKGMPEYEYVRSAGRTIKALENEINYSDKYTIESFEDRLKHAEERNAEIGGRTVEQLDSEIESYTEELKYYQMLNNKLYDRPQRGTPEREEWEKWLESEGGREEVDKKIAHGFFDDDSIQTKLSKAESAKRYIARFGADGGVEEAQKQLQMVKDKRDAHIKKLEEAKESLEKSKAKVDEKQAKLEELRKVYADAVKQKFPTFDDCTTEDEIRERFDCEGNFKSGETISFGSIGLENAKMVASEVDGFFQKNQKLKGKLGSTVVTSIRKRYYGQSTRGGNVELNKYFYSDRAMYEESFKRCVNTGYHPAGLTASSVVYHEYTHQLDDFFSNKLDLPYDGRGKKKRFSTVVFEEVRKNLKMKVRECKEAVSEYAVNNKSGGAVEWLAEAYSEFLCSESPRPVAMEVGKIVTRYLDEL